MKLGIVRLREDRYEQLEQQFQRELTPKERKWLKLADDLFMRAELKEVFRRQEQSYQ